MTAADFKQRLGFLIQANHEGNGDVCGDI